jgi:hypothetical protein
VSQICRLRRLLRRGVIAPRRHRQAAAPVVVDDGAPTARMTGEITVRAAVDARRIALT